MIKPHAKAWDALLPHAEFAYNRAPSKATSLSPFKVVYGLDPLSPLDLTPRPMDQKPSADAASRVEEIKKIHELVRSKIEKTNDDAYSHMHHFYLRSTSKKKSIKQERAWGLSYFLLLCEFKDFRHDEEVKKVAKIWRKLIFLPEELVPDSSLQKVIFVLIFGLAQVDPQLEGPHGFEA